jgi:hypothetical protein
MSILDNKGAEFFQQILPTSPCYFLGINLGLVKIDFSKEEMIEMSTIGWKFDFFLSDCYPFPKKELTAEV